MDKTQYLDSYIEQLKNLKEIVTVTNSRIVSDSPDEFFLSNANFFSKSFLVIMCAYLESYLKDVSMAIIDEANNRLDQSKLPHNLIKWSLNIDKEFKNSEFKFEDFKILIKKRKLDDFVSGNPYRTRDLFTKFGINLESNIIFKAQIERINAIVVKRNKIVHYNDNASDVSNQDLEFNIEAISDYIKNIDKIVCESI